MGYVAAGFHHRPVHSARAWQRGANSGSPPPPARQLDSRNRQQMAAAAPWAGAKTGYPHTKTQSHKERQGRRTEDGGLAAKSEIPSRQTILSQRRKGRQEGTSGQIRNPKPEIRNKRGDR